MIKNEFDLCERKSFSDTTFREQAKPELKDKMTLRHVVSKSSRGLKADYNTLTGDFGSDQDNLAESQKPPINDPASSEELGPFKHDSEKDYD